MLGNVSSFADLPLGPVGITLESCGLTSGTEAEMEEEGGLCSQDNEETKMEEDGGQEVGEDKL